MSRIVLGKAGPKNIELDLDVLLRSHLLLWASTGGGKSWLIRLIAEKLSRRAPIIIVDREGEFATLREKFDYVLAGPGGETPADVRSAKQLAETLLSLRASAVCDLFEMKHETRHQWVATFLSALSDAPKKLWGPRVIIIDEAHTFAPEKGQGESVAYGPLCDLVSVGRKRGFGIILATQRLAKLSKNATGEMYNQAAGPTARQADRDRAAYEMGITGRKEIQEFSDQLRRLEPGMFFFQGRAISMERVLVRVGGVETTHAQAGSGQHAAEPPPAPDKIKALLPKLADLPKMAEEKAKTEAELRAEIRSLKAKLRAQPRNVGAKVGVPSRPDSRAIERVIRTVKDEYGKKLIYAAHVNAQAWREGKKLRLMIDELVRCAAKLFVDEPPRIEAPHIQLLSGPAVRGFSSGRPATVAPARPLPAAHSTRAARSYQPAPTDSQPAEGMTRKQFAILRALAEFEAIGRMELPRTWVAARAGASHKSSAYTNNLGALRTAALIEYGHGTLRLSDAGREAAPHIQAPLSTDEMLESCLKLLSAKQAAILRALHEVHPESLSRAETAEKAGASPTSSAYTNNLGALRSAGMIEYGANSTLRCADWLFID